MSIDSLETVNLSNIGITRGKVSDDVLTVLKTEIKSIKDNFNKSETFNHALAGNIKKEFVLKDSAPIIEPLVVSMAEKYDQTYSFIIPEYDVERGKTYKFALESVWVNFQQRYEFNPLHRHSGIFSFVIWIDIPYFLKYELQSAPGKDANHNKAGMFEFTYTDVLGRLRSETIAVDKTHEGNIILFPASMHHQVYPFYSTDNYRVSVAGNIKLVTDI